MYCLNNPLVFTDPTGLMTQREFDELKQRAEKFGKEGAADEFEETFKDDIKSEFDEGNGTSSSNSGNGSGSGNSGNESNLDLKTADELEIERLQAIIDGVLENIADLKYDPYDWSDQVYDAHIKYNKTVEEIVDEMIGMNNSPFEFINREAAIALVNSELQRTLGGEGTAGGNLQGTTLYYRPINETQSYISSSFDLNRAPIGGYEGHTGVDFASPLNTAVVASREGTVSKVKTGNTGFGNYVVIQHPSGERSYYAHLNSSSVQVGQKLKVGQTLGLVGSTGNSLGPHLHHEVRKGDDFININNSYLPWKPY